MVRVGKLSRTMSANLVAIALAPAVFFALASDAAAEGSASIAGAPVVVYGQQESGNTANGLHVFDGLSVIQGWNSFWGLKVAAGDKLRIDWEAPPRSGTHLNLFPVGTTDYTIARAHSLAYQGQNPEGKNELTFEANQSGVMSLDIRAQAALGTIYSFVVYVHHPRHHHHGGHHRLV